MNSILRKIIIGVLILVLVIICYFFIGFSRPSEDITWGINFSQKYALNLNLDWQKSYLATLEDLKVKKIKLITHWDLIEPQQNNFYFNDLDWQIKKAEEKGAEIILVVGMKTGRWPECHIPDWAEELSKEQQQTRILKLIKEIIQRYKESSVITAWQVENEPLFPFGKCPWYDKEFLKEEIQLVKSLDSQKRPVIVSDSGEFSLWLRAARLGDIVGTTLHRRVWSDPFGIYVKHFWFNPVYYRRKRLLINTIFKKEVICIELQAEPWGPEVTYFIPLWEQKKTMDLEKFKGNVNFARKTGLDTFYFWGTEWWYWLKQKQGEPQIWNEAKKLF